MLGFAQPERLFETSGLLGLHHLRHFLDTQGPVGRTVLRDFARAGVPLAQCVVGVTLLVFNMLQVPSDVLTGQGRDRSFWKSPLVRFLCCTWHPRAIEDVVAVALRTCVLVPGVAWT